MKQFILSALCLLIAFTGIAQDSLKTATKVIPLELSLKQAKEYAFENHPTVKLANIDVALADARIKEALAQGLPQVNGVVDLSYFARVPIVLFPNPEQGIVNLTTLQGENSNFLATKVVVNPETGEFTTVPGEDLEFNIQQPHNLSAGISATQLVFSATYIVGVKLARLYSKLTEKQVQKTAIDTQYDIEQTYLTALIAGDNIKLLQKNLPTIERSLFEASELNKNGFAEAIDVDRIKLSKSNIESQVRNLQEQQKLTVELLRFQMGYPTYEPIILTDSIDVFTELNLAFLDSMDNASQRIEFDLLDMQQELNELQVKRYKSGYYPSLVGFADYNWSSQRNKFLDFKDSWFDTFVLGASINIPIFDGNMKRAQIETSKLNLKQLEIARAQTEMGFDIQKKQAITSYQTALNDKKNQEANLALAQNIYDTALIKYKEGLGSSLEVNSAESTFLQTQASYINSLYSLVLAKAGINKAYGIY